MQLLELVVTQVTHAMAVQHLVKMVIAWVVCVSLLIHSTAIRRYVAEMLMVTVQVTVEWLECVQLHHPHQGNVI